MKTKYLLSAFVFVAFAGTSAAFADDYFELDVEELSKIQVTSAARKPQSLAESAAAMFVVTSEDIRRSGATTIADALRLVPGVQVARIDAYRWAISARGFADAFANKLLVLMDGRVVYSPLFSGVFWDVQDTLIEDIDRIEVIRGPGASLWGANAVNGVINIITKNSTHTQGGFAQAGAGSQERLLGSVRYGGEIGDNTTYRVYAKHNDRRGFPPEDANNTERSGNFYTDRGGFRIDSAPTKTDGLTLQGDLYGTTENQNVVFDSVLSQFVGDEFPTKTHGSGGNIINRWNHTFSATSDMQLQAYFDRMYRNDVTSIHDASTFDLDFQHRFELMENHDFLYGAEYRHYSDHTTPHFLIEFIPPARDLDLYTSFVQDDYAIVPDVLHLIVGSKFEHNAYSGFEIEPNIRAVWTPHEHNTIWAAVSRAARTPSRGEHEIRLVAAHLPPGEGVPLPVIVEGRANRDYGSEYLVAYELGYRLLAAENLSFDIATFFNKYDDLISADLGEPHLAFSQPPHIIQPFTNRNEHSLESYGGELVSDWHPLRWWRFVASYSYINTNLMRHGSDDPGIFTVQQTNVPRHQAMLRSLIDLPRNVQLDSALRFVDDTKSSGDYWELDVRIGWEPIKNLDLSIIAQNLLHPEHVEWSESRFGESTVQVERGLYGRMTWHF